MPRKPTETPSWRALPRVEVEWVDSCGDSGWRSVKKERAENLSLRCATVGYLLEERRGYVKIVQSLSAHESTDNPLAIPRCAIRKITPLVPKEKE